MADRCLRNPEDKHIASSTKENSSRKRQRSAQAQKGETTEKVEQEILPLTIPQVVAEPLKRNKEVEGLVDCGVDNSELLKQPVRVTRSQWRRSVARQRELSSSSDVDINYIHSSNPGSRSTSRGSSPVFRLRESALVDEALRNSPQLVVRRARRINTAFTTSGERASSRSSRNTSPETLPFEESGPVTTKHNRKEPPESDRGRVRKRIKKTNKQSESEKPSSGEIKGSAILTNSRDKDLTGDTKSGDQVARTSTVKSSAEHWSCNYFAQDKGHLSGKKRVRSTSRTQEASGKREKKDEGTETLLSKSGLKSNLLKSAKTGGRLSRTRNSQAQAGERRGTTGSCASSRRSSRRSRAQQGPSAMATDDGRASQQAESADNEPRVDEPIPGSSGSRDSSSNPMEDLEMSRLQALLEARGLPSHLFGNLGPRMHLLLQRTFSSSAGTKAQQLIVGMQGDDEGQQLTSVMEMCQLLVMGNEETLGGFPVKQAVPVLINLLQMDRNFDITNHACRALTYLMEALPRSSAVVVDAVPTFLEKLQVIQCMDVAEQSLTALEMLSRRHGKAILQAGGLNACLLYLDFFSIVAQRCALGIASNCCQTITPEEFHHVSDAISILSGRLTNQDKKSLENVCSAFARLVDNFQRDKKLLKELCAHGLLPNLQQLLMISPPVISTSTFVMVIRMLAIMCANCPAIAVKLFQQNIADTIKYLLIGNQTEENNDVSHNELIPRTPQELYEITCFVSELLPKLPATGVFSVDALLVKGSQQNTTSGCWQWRDDRGVWHNYMWVDNRILEAAHQSNEDEISLSTLGRNYIIDFTNMQQINEDTGTIRSIQRKLNAAENSTSVSQDKEVEGEDERKVALTEEPALGETFVKSLLSVMYDVYYSSVGPAVKHKCLNAALKMLYHSSAECLKPILDNLPISSYLAGMLTSNDPRVVCCALQKAEILMIKLPDIFHVSFRREGVMHRAMSLSVKSDGNVGRSADKAPAEVKPKGVASASELVKCSDSVDGIMVDLDKSPSTGKITESSKRKKISKRLSRQKQSQAAMADDAPSTSSKKGASAYSRTRAATFTTTASQQSSSSKTSFFSSFAPRWGRSQSYTSAAASATGSKERIVKEEDENKGKIKSWIKDQAAKFYESYFGEQLAGDSHPALSILHRLTKAAEDLSLTRDTGIAALKEISDVLKEKNDHGASAFEILHSGLIKSLLRYLTIDRPDNAVQRNIRIKRFLHVFLGCPDPDLLSTRSVEPSAKPCLPALVQKLNLCINQLEQFTVKCHDLPGAVNGSRGTSALRFFNTHQIKCNLQRHNDCHILRQWKGGTVKIDPLALVQAVERYLVIRGFGKVREHGDDEDSDDDEGTDGEIDEAWGSSVGTVKPKHYLELVLNGRVLPYDMTIYQAVRQYGDTGFGEDGNVDDDQGPLGRASIWSETHTIFYRPISPNSAASQPAIKKRSESASSSATSKTSMKSLSKSSIKNTDMSTYLTEKLPGNIQLSDPSLETICLMRLLYYLNIHWGDLYEIHQPHATVSVNEFINAKLSAKVSRQLQDPLAIMTGNLPSWLGELATACAFLFPFECRQQLFYSTTFDRDRALMKLQENLPELASTDTADRVTPRLEKKKRTVPRTDLLEQAENVMNDVAGGRAMLEIQYEGEVGSGLGPTLEFYTLVSKEMQKVELQIWRGDIVEVAEGAGESKNVTSYIHSPGGLFPAPLPKNIKVSQLSKVKSRFRFLGKFVAKAIMDSRMIDLPFSQPFCKWIIGLESTLQLSDIQNIDAILFKSLSQLNDLVKKKKAIERDPAHTIETMRLALGNLTLDGMPVDDLSLDFILPGYGNIELKKNGKDIPVTIDNLEEYIKLVVHWTLIEGVSKQFQAFKEGFESVFPIASLQMFYSSEIDLLLCGSRSEKWDVKELIECCRPDHGYTHDSRAVRFLFDILSKYEAEEQRKFLQFITGSPRLPVGGFRSLNPPLTIVRKTVDGALSPDNYLPSVMTCVNYLKLPDYSSVDIMDEKLRTAYTEGKNAFHLS
ncbi:E3 ubiquitin-protein ligase TRIP12-like [Rhopilema esculentum]|uniref:E3 ubiquitin-protein ligase TRIP12-like n=1 Tax=Rhopilema esculentum TaxID=499914 RepID=UPI0031D3DC75